MTRDWNRYGERSFSFQVVEVAPKNITLWREEKYLQKFYADPLCYNVVKSPRSTSFGCDRRLLSPEHRAAISAWNQKNKWRHSTPETRAKRSTAQKRRWKLSPLSQEARAKIATKLRGNKNKPRHPKPLTDEAREYIPAKCRVCRRKVFAKPKVRKTGGMRLHWQRWHEANPGKPFHSEATRAKMSAAARFKRPPVTAEFRAKMSAIRKQVWATRRARIDTTSAIRA
jgi:hypothetical protein